MQNKKDFSSKPGKWWKQKKILKLQEGDSIITDNVTMQKIFQYNSN